MEAVLELEETFVVRTAIYPGTFDPITHGHSDIIKRMTKMFDEVIVAVAASVRKAPFFSSSERIELIREVLGPMENLEVCSFDGLLVEFAQQTGVNIIVRGLRGAADLDNELALANMNRLMVADIETIFMLPSATYASVSASIVREIASMGGDISPFVHPAVVKACHRLAEQ